MPAKRGSAVRRIAAGLLHWHRYGSHPYRHWFEVMQLPGVEQEFGPRDMDSLEAAVHELVSTIMLPVPAPRVEGSTGEELGPAQIQAAAEQLLAVLGHRGVGTLLGLRATVGSVFVVPPDRDSLRLAFRQRHRPASASTLTVGARALAKHCHRCSAGWWGDCTGSEAEKNAHADAVCERLLSEAVWLNAHCLVGGVTVFEVRTAEGYGARWGMLPVAGTAAGAAAAAGQHVDDHEAAGAQQEQEQGPGEGELSRRAQEQEERDKAAAETSGFPERQQQEQQLDFRGFLEPHATDGHERGWRH